MPALAGKPELAIDRRGHLAHDAQDRRVVVGVAGAPVQPLAAAEVEVVLVDARRDDDRAVPLDDLARALASSRMYASLCPGTNTASAGARSDASRIDMPERTPNARTS